MPVVPYIFLRGLELEGRHPHDVGAWSLTVRRLEVGEGVPLWGDSANWIEFQAGQPYPPAPKLHSSRRGHSFYYRRIRSSAECERVLLRVAPDVPVSVDLFASWGKPPHGVIPMPEEGETRLDATHLVALGGCSPERREFYFRNTWGDNWGDRGYGVLPYDYVDRYVFESWVTYSDPTRELDKFQTLEGRRERRWVVRDEWFRRVYGFEVWDEKGDERCAWAFVLERDGVLEVEELYVRPEFRRRGFGTVLARKVRELAGAKRMPLRLWVAFSDSRQEDPTNYPALVAIARLLGVQFQPCPVIWAAYYATDERAGADTPVEPARIPPRPKSALEAILAMALVVNSGSGDNEIPHSDPGVPMRKDDDFPEPGTAAWAVMNRRRAELIWKKNEEGLSQDEWPEYRRLQRLSQIALQRAFPASTVGDEALARIEARLAATNETNSE